LAAKRAKARARPLVTRPTPKPVTKRPAPKQVTPKRAATKRGRGKGVPAAGAASHRARSLARRLALQALYQLQLNPRSWTDTQKQFVADPEAERVDLDYFRSLLKAIAPNRDSLDSRLAGLCEIAPPELDPIEHAVLWLGLHELTSCPELPYRVALAEAVQLAKQFGATDGHKFVNAVLDRAARELRPHEYGRGQD
jgi:transcription antitermination protein NusB